MPDWRISLVRIYYIMCETIFDNNGRERIMRILKKIIYGVIFCVSIIVLRDNVYADNNINIMKQPVPIIGQEGDEVTWTISAKGENLSYQWQYSADGGKTWNNFGGATTAKLTRTVK